MATLLHSVIHLRKVICILLLSLLLTIPGLSANASPGAGWSLSYDLPAPADYVDALALFNGKLFAGTCCGSAVYSFDGTNWSFNTKLEALDGHVRTLAVYNNKLYAGTNYYVYGTGNRGRVWVYDGTNWSISLDALPDDTVNMIFSLAVYNGKLYAGTGESGRIWVFDGSTWSEALNTAQTAVHALATYNGKLYATGYPNGYIYAYDGTSWQTAFMTGEMDVSALAEYNGKLYAGTGNSGLVYVYDGTTWTLAFDSPEQEVMSFGMYQNKLYAGGYNGANVYVYDGNSWNVDYSSGQLGILSLATYNNTLYAGSATDGLIYQFTPPIVFSGFFSPVDNPGPGPSYVFNKAKAGSGIPVKFSLGGDRGLSIFASGYPVSGSVSCTMVGSLDNIEETVTAGGSSLSYDPGTNQYTYVWKTDKSWAGSCRKLTLRLVDGTDHIGYFNFTK
jgi:hypothetical protein